MVAHAFLPSFDETPIDKMLRQHLLNFATTAMKTESGEEVELADPTEAEYAMLSEESGGSCVELRKQFNKILQNVARGTFIAINDEEGGRINTAQETKEMGQRLAAPLNIVLHHLLYKFATKHMETLSVRVSAIRPTSFKLDSDDLEIWQAEYKHFDDLNHRMVADVFRQLTANESILDVNSFRWNAFLQNADTATSLVVRMENMCNLLVD